jgi:excisionase family DNA binding protein
MRATGNAGERFRPVAVPDSDLLTVTETAALLRCGRTTVFGLISAGVLPSIKPGRARLIKRDDVMGYIHLLRDASLERPARK